MSNLTDTSPEEHPAALAPQRTTLIDTHCHLEMEAFKEDLPAVIRRAREEGLEALITISSDEESVGRALALADRFDLVYASVGMHPHDAKDCSPGVLRSLKDAAAHRKVVAVGETGLDFHYTHSPRETQMEVFRKHLQLAQETGLPVIVHSREARDETLSILRESGTSRGVLHCFSGDWEMAEQAMAMGLYISIAGPVTFKKSVQLRQIARMVPDDYLLIETDSPYLSPEPFRGRRNEPAFLTRTAACIAGLRGISTDDLARITTLNARRLFGVGSLPEKAEIAYPIRDSLYLNITNRCTNACTFCVKFHSDYVKGHKLRLDHEPAEDEIIRAIGDPAHYREVVFCGYGEPFARLEVLKHTARWIKERGGRVRVNTNGHANLIHRRPVVGELRGLVDSISVSLDAHDEETYNRICRPLFGNAYGEMIRFIRQAKEVIPEVAVTVVDLKGVDIEKCRRIAEELGVDFRVRSLNVVG